LRLTRTLARHLKSQIALEAAILVPALRGADAWGEIRAAKLLEQLRRRRRKLRALRRSAAERNQATLGGHIDQYIDDCRSGMAHVERESLNPSVLRDDVTGIDVSGG
jgi:hypothetical protein